MLDFTMVNITQKYSNITVSIKEEETLPYAAYLAIGIYLTLLGIASVICNGIVIIVLIKGRTKFLRFHLVLLMNLAITDLVMSLIAFPLSSSSSYYGRWMYGEGGCTFYGFVVFFLAMGDMNTLVIISVSRYIVACKPKYEYFLKNTSNIRWALVVIWSYALIWTGAPLMGWSRFTQEKYGTSCTINWYGRELKDVTYNTTITATCFVFHASAFIFCYSKIIRQFRIADDSKIHSGNNEGDEGEVMNIEDVVWYHKVTTSRSITFTSLCMISAYTFAWTPYAVVSIWVMYVSDVPIWVHVLPTMMGKSACVVNPIVYCILSENFRKAVKELFVKQKQLVHPQQRNEIELEELPEVRRSSRNISTSTNPKDFKTYSGHMSVSPGIYIGKTEVRLPVESFTI